VKNFGCRLPKFQTGLALVLFGVNDKTEARAEDVKLRHKAQSLNEAPKALTSKVTSSTGINRTNKVRLLPPKPEARTSR